MTEYITKERAQDLIATAAQGNSSRLACTLSKLEDEPAADVVTVVHAENLANAHPSEEFKCSNCGTYLVNYVELREVDGVDDFYIYEFTDWNFCPKCGATMFSDNVIVKE